MNDATSVCPAVDRTRERAKPAARDLLRDDACRRRRRRRLLSSREAVAAEKGVAEYNAPRRVTNRRATLARCATHRLARAACLAFNGCFPPPVDATRAGKRARLVERLAPRCPSPRARWARFEDRYPRLIATTASGQLSRARVAASSVYSPYASTRSTKYSRRSERFSGAERAPFSISRSINIVH